MTVSDSIKNVKCIKLFIARCDEALTIMYGKLSISTLHYEEARRMGEGTSAVTHQPIPKQRCVALTASYDDGLRYAAPILPG